MKVSIISSDMSGNNMGRPYLLAKVLMRKYDVELIGFASKEGVWWPIENDGSLACKTIKVHGRLDTCRKVPQLFKAIDGDIVYAMKPSFFSFGIGLLSKYIKRRSLLIDIDDWELGFMHDRLRSLRVYEKMVYFISSTLFPIGPGSLWDIIISEKLVRFADEITVSNKFLQGRFGGTLIRHGRDTDLFNPSRYDKSTERQRYGIEANKKVIIFFGTPRPYKGLEDLIDACKAIEQAFPDMILVMVGMDLCSDYCLEVIERGSALLDNKFKWFPQQPFEKVPEFLCMADLVVIPQRNTPSTRGQNPAKIFDAMAMAKPIITTDVSDLKEIIEDCGWVIEPSNIGQLASAIAHALIESKEAKELGLRAREKCLEEYSFTTIERKLERILEDYSCM